VLAVPTLAAAAAGLVFHVPGLIAVASLPALAGALLAWLISRQVKAIGYFEGPEELFIRRGVMFRRLQVMPYGRLQYLDVTTGPLARRFGIAALQLHTAAVGLDVALPGLPPNEAAGLRERLVARGEARMSGL
jgi:membrane protein YdbS with pleckstrin-like domain